MPIHRWRNVFTLTNSITPSLSSSHSASFHSTPISLAKWKNKWNSDAGRAEQPTKNYIRYAIRQKRADTKKSLKDLIGKKLPFQVVRPTMNTYRTSGWDAEEDNDEDGFNTQSEPKKEDGDANGSHKQSRSKKYSCRRTARQSSRARKGKPREEYFDDDFEEPKTFFRATFGGRSYTWSFRSWEDSHSKSSSTGFEWRDQRNWTGNSKRRWDSASDDDNDSSDVGAYAHRKILGLPLTGTIKVEDVKIAFRSSAMKWHPDRHEGPSQAAAEEKFKLCVDAYKSLCSALS